MVTVAPRLVGRVTGGEGVDECMGVGLDIGASMNPFKLRVNIRMDGGGHHKRGTKEKGRC